MENKGSLPNSPAPYTCPYPGPDLQTDAGHILRQQIIEVKKFPAFYGKQRFITTFTSALHMSLPWARFTDRCSL